MDTLLCNKCSLKSFEMRMSNHINLYGDSNILPTGYVLVLRLLYVFPVCWLCVPTYHACHNGTHHVHFAM